MAIHSKDIEGCGICTEGCSTPFVIPTGAEPGQVLTYDPDSIFQLKWSDAIKGPKGDKGDTGKKVPKGIRVRKGNRVYRDCVESVESVDLKEPEARRERRERRETGALKEPEARKGRKEIQARRDRGGR